MGNDGLIVSGIILVLIGALFGVVSYLGVALCSVSVTLLIVGAVMFLSAAWLDAGERKAKEGTAPPATPGALEEDE